MARPNDQTRRSSAGLTATTLLVLAAAVAAAPAPSVRAESTLGVGEAKVMRAVAAAVAAAAREMAGGERTVTAMPVLPAFAAVVAEAPPLPADRLESPRGRAPLLDERLLDLPPPLI